MLQINTGKFFRDVELYTTRQRNVLYANYHRLYNPIVTAAGTLLPTGTTEGVAKLIYEVDEKLEAVTLDGKPEFLIAVTGDYLMQDFASVVSFALNITCTPDVEVARRLTQVKTHPFGISKSPNEYIRRVFDERIEYATGDDIKLTEFVHDLMGLKRSQYEAAIRAIRRYIVGLHRIGDDLEMSYTMFVAAIESLAQGFDGFTPTWTDYKQESRQEIDKALKGLDLVASERVRSAIIKGEHLALSRRFREFVLANVDPSYFRQVAKEEVGPIRRSELIDALDGAYKFRSKAVHSLRELPRSLTAVPSHRDTDVVDGKPVLSLHGMARLSRHIITQFVRQGEKTEKEEFEYRSALPNIVHLRLSEELWLWQGVGYNAKSARLYLTGFLSQYTQILMATPEAATRFTDLSQVMEEIETRIDGLAKPEQRLPLFVLYLIYNASLKPELRRPKADAMVKKHYRLLALNEPESLMTIAMGFMTDYFIFSANDLAEAWAKYEKQKNKSGALDFGAIIDAACLLTWAETCRKDSDITRAKELISQALEELPGNERLLQFESTVVDLADSDIPPINWRSILLPPRPEAELDPSNGWYEI